MSRSDCRSKRCSELPSRKAALSAAVLERGGRTSFEQVFLTSLNPAARYDIHLHLTVRRFRLNAG
jgi:hypothetical protein